MVQATDYSHVILKFEETSYQILSELGKHISYIVLQTFSLRAL